MIDIKQIKSKIINKLKYLKPEKIILFGSYAYGSPTEDSDLDLCIVVKRYKGSKWDEIEEIDTLLDSIKIGRDILVPTSEEYDFYKNEFGSVYKDIEEKGVVLWSS